MDPSSALDPPDNNNVELRPFVRGSHSSRFRRLGSNERNPTGSYLDTYLSSTPQRKKGLLVLLSVLCVSLLVMTAVKRGAVDLEQKVELGETEVAHHVNLDHHQGGGGPGAGPLPTEVKAGENVAQPAEPVNVPAAVPVAEEEVKTEPQQEVKVEKTEVEETKANEEPVKVVQNVDHTGYQPQEMIPTTFFLPGTEDAPRGSAAGGGFEYPLTNHFQIRNPNSPTASTWGFFDFEDPKKEWRGKVRPTPDFDSVPHRDVKGSDFPDGAWQKDAEYMTQFLSEAKKLVNRTMEAIYAEYGVGVVGGDLSKLSEERQQQRELFAPMKVLQDINDDAEWATRKKTDGWTTKDSLDGLARRIIHAIMTQDTFYITLGGHSAAAGHGNGHNQSYTIQAGHVLEPVFAHLGVALRAYNTAQGGLGTVQQAMAGMDLRGKESDVIMWDSSMTENSQPLHTFFMKTALISGNRAPFLMSYFDLREFGKVANADVGYHGEGWNGPETLNEKQALEVPWSARYLNCPRASIEICKAHEYEGNGCWVERPDFKPPTEQKKQPGGQTSWHPGNRIHKIKGRRIALLILRGLEHALNKWDELTAGSHPLADEHWHVTDYYKNIKKKAVDVPGCPALDAHPIGSGRRRGLRGNETERQLKVEYWPWRICNLPLQGRSLFGPRAVNPVETSLVAILKPNPMGDLDPTPNNAYLWPPVYYPPELIGPWNVVPPNDVDVVEIAGARRLKEVVRIDDDDKIIPGYGIDIKWGRPGHCDGSSHSWCDKTESSDCLMGNTQDSHGMICFNDLSGWLVFDVKGVKHGFIGAKMENWHTNKDNKVTAGWTEVNNGGTGNYNATGRQRRLLEQNQRRMILAENNRMQADLEREVLQDPERRQLGGGKSCGYGPEDYTFEYAINGKIVTWNKKQFCEQYTRLAYNTDMIRFMDDEKMTGDFEFAMRLKNTGSNEEMCITHLYWA